MLHNIRCHNCIVSKMVSYNTSHECVPLVGMQHMCNDMPIYICLSHQKSFTAAVCTTLTAHSPPDLPLC